VNLGYITEKGKGRWKGQGRSKTPYELLLPFPPCTSAGWPPMCVFGMVNKAWRYLATSILVNMFLLSMTGLSECLARVLLKSAGTDMGILALLKTYIDQKFCYNIRLKLIFFTN
jgi:hypothetical protein